MMQKYHYDHMLQLLFIVQVPKSCLTLCDPMDPFDALHPTAVDKAKSSVMNRAFFKTVSAKKFRATEKCVACGLCEKVCPLKNITLTDGRPVWGDHCTHCMACISRCPKRAIEYGKGTERRGRYVCPER